jgi:predicted metalloprotease
LPAASAIGGDSIQKQAQGYVVPESFTHGTSEQRVRWFRKGFQTGNLADGETFTVPDDQL